LDFLSFFKILKSFKDFGIFLNLGKKVFIIDYAKNEIIILIFNRVLTPNTPPTQYNNYIPKFVKILKAKKIIFRYIVEFTSPRDIPAGYDTTPNILDPVSKASTGHFEIIFNTKDSF